MRFPIASAYPIAISVWDTLAPFAYEGRMDWVGEFRGMPATLSTIDVLIETASREALPNELWMAGWEIASKDALQQCYGRERSPRLTVWILDPAMPTDLFGRPTPEERFSLRTLMLSGSPEFRASLKATAKKRNMRLDPIRGLVRGNQLIACAEASILRELRLGWIPPEARFSPILAT